jgi:HAE1 family hydrophobic/amphiphilic exporter-1
LTRKIAPVLSRVQGVAQVNIIGGQEREIQVNLDATKMQAMDYRSQSTTNYFKF